MKVSVEDLSPVKKKIIVEVPPETIEKEITATYKDLGTKVSIPGFRKGKIPRSILETHYKDYVLGEVVSKLIDNSYPEVIKEKNITPVARPEIKDVKKIEEGKVFSYTATVEVRPDIKVEGYVGMELKKEAPAVSDTEMEKSLELLRERNAQFTEVERAAKEPDMVLVDFEGTMDGKPMEHGKASDYPVVIGSNTLVPDFENGLTGLKKGEQKEVKVRFPEDYHAKELAGKDAVFKVTAKAVKEKVLPNLDDEFAKDLKLDTFAQLKERVKESILQQKEAEEKERLKKEIFEQMVKKTSFDVPATLVNAYLRPMMAQLAEDIGSGAASKTEDANMTPEKIREKYTAIAETKVREDLIVDAIARQESIVVSDGEIDMKIKELAVRNHQRFAELKKHLQEQGTDEVLAARILEDKVVDFIIAKAK